MFGSRLKLALENAGISQVQLAQELNLTGPAINRWCNNITEPDTVSIVKIAKRLNVSTDYLLGNDSASNTVLEDELRKKELLRELLIKNGYMKDNEDLSDDELDKLMKFLNANKEFIKENK